MTRHCPAALFGRTADLAAPAAALALALWAAFGAGGCEKQSEVNVYSGRQEVLMRPLFDRFTEETGIRVNVVSAGADDLFERMQREGANSPADVLLTVDAGRLIRAAEAGLFQPLHSPTLEANIPAKFRDPAGLWFGLTMRGRPIMYAKERLEPSAITTYEELTNERWKGRVCVRSSNNVYNQSLLAAMIAHLGVEKTEAWARGLVANLARPPEGGDRDQIKAVAAGQCDLTLANTYYLAGLAHAESEADRAAAAKVGVIWPNQQDRGVHVNVSGAGVAAHAPNPENARRFLEFLSSPKAQRIYADVVFEFPVNPAVKPSQEVLAWGDFKADELPLAELAKHQAEAVRTADRAGWR